MEPTDLTHDILRSIRDEIRGLGARQDGTNERLDRVVREQIRQGTELIELKSAVHEMRGDIHEMRGDIHEMRELQRETVAAVGRLTLSVDTLGRRLDHVLVGTVGEAVRDHELRIQRLEQDRDRQRPT